MVRGEGVELSAHTVSKLINVHDKPQLWGSQQMGDADFCYDHIPDAWSNFAHFMLHNMVYSNCRHLVETKRLSINAYAAHFSYTHSLLNKQAQYFL